MVVLEPKGVRLDGEPLTGVLSVLVDRVPERFLEEWEDGGPHAVFADAGEIRTTVRVTRLVGGGDLGLSLMPGDEAELRFDIAPNASGAGGQRVTVAGVVYSVRHDAPAAESGGRRVSATEVLEVRAVSNGGHLDPVLVEAWDGEGG